MKGFKYTYEEFIKDFFEYIKNLDKKEVIEYDDDEVWAASIKKSLDESEGKEKGWILKDAFASFKKRTREQQMELGFFKHKKALLDKFSPDVFAKDILRDNKFLLDKHDRFWRYDIKEGLWKEDAGKFLRSHIRKEVMGSEEQRKAYIEEIYSYIKDISWKDEEPNFLPSHYVAFKNCLYDLKEDRTRPLSSHFFITTKLPVNYPERGGECPRIIKFLKEVVGDEMYVTLLDLAAYCLYREYSYQKLFILFGAGANGKSVYLDMLRCFLGEQNISCEEPQQILENKFSRGNLWRKLANISNDINYNALKNTAIMKLLTGQDPLNCERKYKEPFTFKNFAKLIFSTNQVPATNDKTYAWYRRIYLIEFPKSFKKKADRDLLTKLTSEEELEGFAYLIIERLKLFINRNYTFEYHPDDEKMAAYYEALSNPLSAFLNEETIESGEDYIYKFELKQRFKHYLQKKKLRNWTDIEIGREMNKLYQEGQRGDKLYRAWIGVRWRGQIMDFQTPKNELSGGNEGPKYERERSCNPQLTRLTRITPFSNKVFSKTEEEYRSGCEKGVIPVNLVSEVKKNLYTCTQVLDVINLAGGEVDAIEIERHSQPGVIDTLVSDGDIVEMPAGRYKLLR